MLNLFYSLPPELQHKIKWMNVHSEMHENVVAKQAKQRYDIVVVDFTRAIRNYKHDILSDEMGNYV